jgi:hypothetical protein
MRKTLVVVIVAVVALAGFMAYSRQGGTSTDAATAGAGGRAAPLARVVIGELAASTLITLVFVPTTYTIFEEGWKGLRSGLPKHS